MKLPDKYSYLNLYDMREQIILLELFSKKSLRTNKLYKMGIVKSNQTLNILLKNLINKNVVKKNKNKIHNITYELTPKGLNLACLIASNEKMFNTQIGEVIFIANFGKEINNNSFKEKIRKFFLDYFKKYYDYRIDVNGI